MRIGDVTLEEMEARLAGPGLDLVTGSFVARIQTNLASVAAGIHLLYADHTVEDARDFADFHVHLARPAGVRRWLRPQVVFYFDGNPPFKPLPLDQAFPLLEWGLNWCVSSQCHQFLIIHAAIIERGGRAAVLPGQPGAGKSTLCAGLVARGWRLLSDELTLIDPQTARFVPLVRPVSLKNQSIEVIRDFAPGAVIGPVATDTTKGTVAHMKPPATSVARSGETARPGWIIFPRYRAGGEARFDDCPRSRAFMRLAGNAFNYTLHGARGFDTLAAVVESSRCYEFSYGDLAEAANLFETLPAPP